MAIRSFPRFGRQGRMGAVSSGTSRPRPDAERSVVTTRARAAVERSTRSADCNKVELLHRVMPVVYTRDEFRALHRDRLISAASKECLQSKFGETLEASRRAMEMLAGSLPLQEITLRAYHLYEEFRPEIPASVRGWGGAGKLLRPTPSR